MSVIDVTPDVTIKIEIGGGSVDTEKLSTATNLLNGEAEGSLRSVNAAPETDEYKLGKNSNALGKSTQAPGEAAFATGLSTSARNRGSFAGGMGTLSQGVAAHSEGNSTQALSDYQHVQGKHNIPDSSNRYPHIVGNGTSYNDRSNAHTLDWHGNAWFAGDVIVGGKSQDDADAKVLATQEYVEQKVGEIEIPSIEGLATEQFVRDEISEIEIPSLDGYATEAYVDDKIANIDFPDENDALDLLSELGFVEPLAADDGAIYTDNNNVMYVL